MACSDVELNEQLLGMSEEEIRALERWVAREMAAQLEALLFAAPPFSAFTLVPYQRDEQPFIFYRPKS
jgi:hypothetical protein